LRETNSISFIVFIGDDKKIFSSFSKLGYPENNSSVLSKMLITSGKREKIDFLNFDKRSREARSLEPSISN
jgi:hypothetical protein